MVMIRLTLTVMVYIDYVGIFSSFFSAGNVDSLDVRLYQNK